MDSLWKPISKIFKVSKLPLGLRTPCVFHRPTHVFSVHKVWLLCYVIKANEAFIIFESIFKTGHISTSPHVEEQQSIRKM
jgi:hypothetical protein